MTLLETVSVLAGDLRRPTFVKAVEWALLRGENLGSIVETGCFRGMECDGNSTLILALLAKKLKVKFWSIDISAEQIAKARAHLIANNANNDAVNFVTCDSVEFLSLCTVNHIGLIYLDSFDHSVNDPEGGQLHQIAELGAAYGKLAEHAAVLLDDNIKEDGGKTKLSADFLKRRGWTEAATGYQQLFTR